MELTSHRVADERAAQARALLADYLRAHGQPPELAQGAVGDRYLERSAGAATPSAVFAEWFGELLDVPANEAEDAGWIAFLATRAAPPDQLLASFISGRVVDEMRAATPLPRHEARLHMPSHDLTPPPVSETVTNAGKAVGRALGVSDATHAGTGRAR